MRLCRSERNRMPQTGVTPGRSSAANRYIATPSSYAREHYLYVQEIGTLQSLSPHVNRRKGLHSCLIFLVLSGSGAVSYDGVRYPISTGDCLYIDCDRSFAHESSASDPWSLMWVHFYGREAAALYAQYESSGCPFLFHPQNPTVFADTIGKLIQVQLGTPSFRELYTNRYLYDLVTLCFDSCSPAVLSGPASIDDKLDEIRLFIERNYTQKINLEDLSSRFYISKFYLSREYRKRFGITIGNDITAHRISLAKSDLRFSDRSVDDIGRACGFSDADYFIRQFKRSEGTTPLQYRRSWR